MKKKNAILISCLTVIIGIIIIVSTLLPVINAPDGVASYTANVTMTGGTGKAKIESPCTVSQEGSVLIARIVWSSSNYDYMKVEGGMYLPLDGEATSVFLIPIKVDEEMSVIADTVAMSTPHEIEYKLTFSELKEVKTNTFKTSDILLLIAGVLIMITGPVISIKKMKKAN